MVEVWINHDSPCLISERVWLLWKSRPLNRGVKAANFNALPFIHILISYKILSVTNYWFSLVDKIVQLCAYSSLFNFNNFITLAVPFRQYRYPSPGILFWKDSLMWIRAKITTASFLSVVHRHPFDADPDPELHYDADPHPDRTGIRTIRYGSYPIFSNCWKIGKKYLLFDTSIHSNARLRCFSFLISGKSVMILSILDSIVKCSGKSQNAFAWNWYRSGSAGSGSASPEYRSRSGSVKIKRIRILNTAFSYLLPRSSQSLFTRKLKYHLRQSL